MIKPSGSSHWYTRDGEPAYDATLRDARKLDLVPSVTSIIGILDKPAIVAWKVNTMLECAWDINGTNKESWIAEVEAKWQAETSKAANVGTAIHDFAETYCNERKAEKVIGYEKQCALLAEWIDANIKTCTCEKSFSAMGYGGRIDAYGTLVDGRSFLLDFKTQNCKDKKATFYPEWKWQLAAYSNYFDIMQNVIMSVVIDTGDIDKIQVKVYTYDEIIEADDIFMALKRTFYILKGL